MGFSGKRRKGQGAAAPPSPLVRIGLGKGGRPPFLLLYFLLPSSPLGGLLLGLGVLVGLHILAAPIALAGLLLLHPLYTEARGTP
jgi:hypothetical protein